MNIDDVHNRIYRDLVTAASGSTDKDKPPPQTCVVLSRAEAVLVNDALVERKTLVSILKRAREKCAELRKTFNEQCRRASDAKDMNAVGLRGDRLGVVASIEGALEVSDG